MTSTYESVHTRAFRGGRTECARTCSSEGKKWVQMMDDSEATKQEKGEALQAACKKHVGRLIAGLRGQGIDRHMLGWRVAGYENGLEEPDLFKDAGFKKMNDWKLSTSQAPANTLSFGGFGPVVDDGYGINYQLHREIMTISVTAKNKCSTTSATKFKDELIRALHDMAKLFPKLPPKL
eukprot:TRINITY_DN3460_c0_g1_i3.p1 TRINITY_DN3460_c0_g1~~TRINITY_DN3460_c0_g1_i3.p1  ORF type:complete len:179 (-),score=55.07 TRINITY_DN3460_c0_g1_i3:525-1061(-)